MPRCPWYTRNGVKVPTVGGSKGSNACTTRWLLRSVKADRSMRRKLDSMAPNGVSREGRWIAQPCNASPPQGATWAGRFGEFVMRWI